VPVWPSHNSGIEPFFQFPSNNTFNAGAIALGSVPINSFVPIETVSGLSVLFLSVIQGIPRTVVSYVIPPESVITAFALSTR